MTVQELIDVLSTLPPRQRAMEVILDGRGYNGPSHVAVLEIPRRRRTGSNHYPHLRPERLEKKLRISGGANWQHIPNEWRLEGSWPVEAAEIGIEREGDR